MTILEIFKYLSSRETSLPTSTQFPLSLLCKLSLYMKFELGNNLAGVLIQLTYF